MTVVPVALQIQVRIIARVQTLVAAPVAPVALAPRICPGKRLPK